MEFFLFNNSPIFFPLQFYGQSIVNVLASCPISPNATGVKRVLVSRLCWNTSKQPASLIAYVFLRGYGLYSEPRNIKFHISGFEHDERNARPERPQILSHREVSRGALDEESDFLVIKLRSATRSTHSRESRNGPILPITWHFGAANFKTSARRSVGRLAPRCARLSHALAAAPFVSSTVVLSAARSSPARATHHARTRVVKRAAVVSLRVKTFDETEKCRFFRSTVRTSSMRQASRRPCPDSAGFFSATRERPFLIATSRVSATFARHSKKKPLTSRLISRCERQPSAPVGAELDQPGTLRLGLLAEAAGSWPRTDRTRTLPLPRCSQHLENELSLPGRSR